MQATLSILGIYNYDNSIFDDMVLPESVDKEILMFKIFKECSELELILPNPYYIKNQLRLWSKQRLFIWERFLRVVNQEYDPLENYNRIEESTENRNKDNVDKNSETSTTDYSGTGSLNGSGSLDGTDDTTHGVVGFDGSSPKTNDTQNTETTQNTTTTQNTKDSYTNEYENNYSSDRNETETTSNTIHARGNIGVTTSQQMLTEEIKILDIIDIYTFIVDDFKSEFCVLVY